LALHHQPALDLYLYLKLPLPLLVVM